MAAWERTLSGTNYDGKSAGIRNKPCMLSSRTMFLVNCDMTRGNDEPHDNKKSFETTVIISTESHARKSVSASHCQYIGLIVVRL